MFRLDLFPAREGDALLLSWGDEEAPKRMLVDAGRKATAASILSFVEENAIGAIDLFVITHIDRDHIEGALKLLGDKGFWSKVKRIWFNGRRDLQYEPAPGFEELGARQGEALTSLILQHGLSWNAEFAGAPVVIVGAELPVLNIEGLKVSVASPDLDQLARLASKWDEEAPREGWESYGAIDIATLAHSNFTSDRAKPNASSIALIVEFAGKRILLAADAHSERLVRSLSAYAMDRERGAAMDLVKASHHGSRGNTSRALVELVGSSHWAISTNGDQFNHPDDEALARMVEYSPAPVTLHFNYKTEATARWSKLAAREYRLRASFGRKGRLSIDLMSL